jgi:hypothetical protein
MTRFSDSIIQCAIEGWLPTEQALCDQQRGLACLCVYTETEREESQGPYRGRSRANLREICLITEIVVDQEKESKYVCANWFAQTHFDLGIDP